VTPEEKKNLLESAQTKAEWPGLGKLPSERIDELARARLAELPKSCSGDYMLERGDEMLRRLRIDAIVMVLDERLGRSP
jgi:hypothetical protein